jgi:uncharacterized membrane protein
MKSRNKEVNIFNMSLLDILCGALGAFCFMMLSLFPDHAKVKELQAQVEQMENQTGNGNARQQIEQAREQARRAQQEAQQAREERDRARADQTLAFFMIAWDGRSTADVDLWLQTPNGKYLAPKKADVPPDKFADTIPDKTKGGGPEQVWFTNAAAPGSVYRLFARLKALNSDQLPVRVNGYIAARLRLNDEHSYMSVRDLDLVPLSKEGDFLELGSLEFTSDDFVIGKGPRQQTQRSTTQMLGVPEPSRLLSAPKDLMPVPSARP